MPLSSYVSTDDLTVLLGLSAAALFLLQNLYKPQPLVHPILLGRQSDVAPVRNPSESAVYRNYSTSAMGRVSAIILVLLHLLTAEPQLPLRPTAGIQTIIDLVRADVDSPRTLWSTKVSHMFGLKISDVQTRPRPQITNAQLLKRVKAFASGLDKLSKFKTGESKVLFLLNSGLGEYSNSARELHKFLLFVVEFLIADLAFTAKSITTMTISSSELLAEVLDKYPPSAIITDSDFLPHIIEQIYDLNQHSHTTVIVVGDPGSVGAKLVREIDLVLFNDIEKEGASNPVDLSPPTGEPCIETTGAGLTILQMSTTSLPSLSQKPQTERVSRQCNSLNRT